MLAGCADDEEAPSTPFALTFEAVNGADPANCTAGLSGLGSGEVSVGVSDLRFYVSNLRAYDAAGAEVGLAFDDNEFQYRSDADWVALIDLTGNEDGTCANSSIAFAEGTARTNSEVVGIATGGPIDRITFDVGVPQRLMRETIANHTAEGAPSPLAEMHWSWASAYRHFVFNFTVQDATDQGEGYVHVGSRDCGGDGARALTDQDACGLVYTPTVDLQGFDPGTNRVAVDLGALLTGLDFRAPIYDPMTFEVIGEGVGVECHSAPEGQPDCQNIFGALGIDMTTGLATGSNQVFRSR
ncbi:MAG: MbnP family copper-binding protein [Myxococcota bacterium]